MPALICSDFKFKKIQFYFILKTFLNSSDEEFIKSPFHHMEHLAIEEGLELIKNLQLHRF